MDCQDFKGRTPLFYASKVGSLVDIIELVKYGANVDHVSKKGKTALFKAKNYDTVKLLLKYGADFTIKDKEGKTPIEYLLKYNSKCPRAILDESLIKQSNETLIMDFEVFECNSQDNHKHHEMDLFIAIKKTKRTDLFLHPLMQIFMSLKFSQVTGYFTLSIIAQLVFTVALTSIGICFVKFIHCDEVDGKNISSWTNETYDESKVECIKNTLKPLENVTHQYEITVICESLNFSSKCVHVFWFTSMVKLFMIIRAINEFYKMFMYIKHQGFISYVSKAETFVGNMILTLSFSFIGLALTDIELATHIAGWMVFFVWIDLILLLGKFDEPGRYILMSIDVMKTMLFVLFTYTPCFFAFVFGFFILLQPMKKFRSYFATFVKIFSMMVGDLNYDEDFSYDQVEIHGARNMSTQIMFLMFVIAVMLIILNLLLAVTVSKTEHLVEASIKLQTKGRITDVVQSNNVPKWLERLKKCCQTSGILSKTKPILKRCREDRNQKFTVSCFSFLFQAK